MQNDATGTRETYVPRFRLETHAQVEKRVGRSRATLCAMRDPKDRRFDPSFPRPIPVGPPGNPYASIRFDASEVDDWIKSRMDMRHARGEVAPTRPDVTRRKCRSAPP
jgi:predicted DNA-binding transcriptional regulator AlpA